MKIEVYEDAVSLGCVDVLILQLGFFWLILEDHEIIYVRDRNIFIFIHIFFESRKSGFYYQISLLSDTMKKPDTMYTILSVSSHILHFKFP